MATKSDDASIRMEPIVLSGELEKRGGSHKNWKKRFFVLSPFGIGYKPGEKDTKFIRVLSLSGAYPVPSPKIDPRRPYCFVVMTIERDFNLVVDAGSQENMRKWVIAIRIAKDRLERSDGEQDVGEESEEIVRNSLKADREVLILDREKELKIRSEMKSKMIQESEEWGKHILELLDMKREKYLEMHTRYVEDIRHLKELRSDALTEASKRLVAIEEQSQKEAAHLMKEHAENFKNLHHAMLNELDNLRKSYSSMKSSFEQEKGELHARLADEVRGLTDKLLMKDAALWELKKEVLMKKHQMAVEKQNFEQKISDMTMELAERVERERSRVDIELRTLKEQSLKNERSQRAKVHLLVAELERGYKDELADLIRERDEMVLKARFGHDLSLDDGTPFEFYSGTALTEATEHIKLLTSRVVELETALRDTGDDWERKFESLRLTSAQREEDLRSTISQFKKQLEQATSVHESQLALFQSTHRKETAELEAELKRVMEENSKLTAQIKTISSKLHSKELEVARFDMDLEVAVGESMSELQAEKMREMGTYMEQIGGMKDEIASLEREVAQQKAQLGQRSETEAAHAEYQWSKKLLGDYDSLEHEKEQWKLRALQLEKGMTITTMKFDYRHITWDPDRGIVVLADQATGSEDLGGYVEKHTKDEEERRKISHEKRKPGASEEVEEDEKKRGGDEETEGGGNEDDVDERTPSEGEDALKKEKKEKEKKEKKKGKKA
eukprot:TRINITY_DN80226_c0_g1_i1.p1 TRINITY_DN80226_c0_g1~~TRINITY_DN80226_c0_g1_i1.p1  ORF type:complete len:731 (+),score=295.57 TRINITY_DN80226_c0_g1_i1:361-2553(+)